MAYWFRRIASAILVSCLLIGGVSAEVVYNRGNDDDPETLDPHKTSTISESRILRDLLEGLVTVDAAGVTIPGAAEKWEISADGTVYTFTLRPDGRWSNGDPVKASDFVYSYRRILSPETGAKYANVLFPILNAEEVAKGQKQPDELGVSAPDDRTVIIRLKSATPYFLQLLTHQTSLPVHPASVEKHGKDFVKAGNYLTNGPYMLAEYVPNSKLRIVKNKFYYDAAKVQIDTVNYFPVKDQAASIRRYQAGELDTLSDLPGEQIASLKERFGKQVVLGPNLGIWALVLNSSKPPLDDVRVRRALSLVIDREFIAEQIFGGAMVASYSLVPPGIQGYEPAYADFKDISPIDREEEAIRLLKEAGYGPGLKPLKVEIRYNTTDSNKSVVIAIGDMWKQIGVETSFINTDGKTHFAYLRDGGDFEVARYGWNADYADPQNFLFLLETGTATFNYGKYSNPEYDGLMQQAARELDAGKRMAMLHKAEGVFMRDMPWIPVVYYGSRNMVSPKIKGFKQNILEVNRSRFLSKEQ